MKKIIFVFYFSFSWPFIFALDARDIQNMYSHTVIVIVFFYKAIIDDD